MLKWLGPQTPKVIHFRFLPVLVLCGSFETEHAPMQSEDNLWVEGWTGGIIVSAIASTIAFSDKTQPNPTYDSIISGRDKMSRKRGLSSTAISSHH